MPEVRTDNGNIEVGWIRRGTTQVFTVSLKIDGVIQDVSVGFIFRLMVKYDRYDNDTDALFVRTADSYSTTSALFALDPTETLLPVGKHFWEITAEGPGVEYVLLDKKVEIKGRVEDQPS